MLIRYFGYAIAVIVLIIAFKDLQEPSNPTLWKDIKKQQDQKRALGDSKTKDEGR